MSKKNKKNERIRGGRRPHPSPLEASILAPKSFGDLDNPTINSIFCLSEAGNALKLAKTCRRLFTIYKTQEQNKKLRLSRRYDTVIAIFSDKLEDITWKARLGHSTIHEPQEPLLVKFVNKEIDNPDFTFNHGTQRLRAMFEKNSVQREVRKIYAFARSILTYANCKMRRPTLYCHVESGNEKLGLIALFNFLLNFLDLDKLCIEDTDAEALNLFAGHPLPLIRHLQLELPVKLGISMENEILGLTEANTALEALVLRFFEGNFSDDFYENSSIKRLQTFATFEGGKDLDVSRVKWKNFLATPADHPSIPVEVIKTILEEWKEDRREIGFWHFFLDVERRASMWNQLTTEEATTRIVGDSSFEVKLNTSKVLKGLLRSKSGKELTLIVEPWNTAYKITMTTETEHNQSVWTKFFNLWW